MNFQPYPQLASPIRLGSLTLRNRIVMGSMHTRLESQPDGANRQAAFYAERAKGGAALIITGGVSPDRWGKIAEDAGALTGEEQIAEHRIVTDAVHAAGAPILLQILHAGRYAKTRDDPVGASDIPSPINKRRIRALSDTEVDACIADYARCAVLAQRSGYDGVEVMGSEGYLITQFTSPRTNNRSDRWGGSFDNRMRFPVAIVRRIREATGPGFVITFRISAIDLVEGGLTAAEVQQQARLLQAAGVDGFDTGIGWHEARVPTIAYMVPRAAWGFTAKRLREAVSVPVMATNRINTPEVAEQLIADGTCDLVALGRPMLADPFFARKALEGRADEINTCIGCNQACLDFIFRGEVATCLVNPRAGHETEYPTGKAETSRRVAVIGAGAAGLSCAVTAAERGHQVMLYEAAPVIGGQMNLAAKIPGKEFAETMRYFGARLQKENVTLCLNTRPDAQQLKDAGYDAVVIATGVTPRIPDIAGIDHPKAMRYDEVLSGRRVPGERVAIMGAGGIGFDTAIYLAAPHAVSDTATFLADWGVDRTGLSAGGLTAPAPPAPPRNIVVLQRKSTPPGKTLGATTGWSLRAELARRGVKFIGGVTYERIDDLGLHCTVEGAKTLFEVDSVVLCAGQEPERSLADELLAIGVEAVCIGGADYAAELDALRAIDQGIRVGLGL